jgi:hypothetical protein
MEYFSQYGQAEMLSWLLKSIFKKFPEAQAALTDPSNPDQPIVKKMAEIATSSAASKIK